LIAKILRDLLTGLGQFIHGFWEVRLASRFFCDLNKTFPDGFR